jgi:3-methylcrotonyl-CoA carboxylase alpha subunit
MGEAAIKAAQAINYEGAGTVEFLLDTQGEFFFMEMNTRLQVEHPVTEMISGQDLVQWQLLVAAGEALPCTQDQLKINGHAFEARIYAEDPDHDFLPATGRLSLLKPPTETTHSRVDSGVVEGDSVSIYYDPMIAKLVVWDSDRERALRRLTQALAQYRIGGIKTNIGFLYNLATIQAFDSADVDTGYIEQHWDEIFRRRDQDIRYATPLAAAAVQHLRDQQSVAQAKASSDPNSPWHASDNWGLPNASCTIQIQETEVTTEAEAAVNLPACGTSLADSTVVADDAGFDLFTPQGFFRCREVKPDFGLDDEFTGGSLTAPMNGTVVALLSEPGVTVVKGDTLLVMEAMKMEHCIVAPTDGQATEFYFQPGDLVDGGTVLLAFEAIE